MAAANCPGNGKKKTECDLHPATAHPHRPNVISRAGRRPPPVLPFAGPQPPPPWSSSSAQNTNASGDLRSAMRRIQVAEQPARVCACVLELARWSQHDHLTCLTHILGVGGRASKKPRRHRNRWETGGEYISVKPVAKAPGRGHIPRGGPPGPEKNRRGSLHRPPKLKLTTAQLQEGTRRDACRQIPQMGPAPDILVEFFPPTPRHATGPQICHLLENVYPPGRILQPPRPWTCPPAPPPIPPLQLPPLCLVCITG